MSYSRKVLKELVHFGKREFLEKKPKKVSILRVKDPNVFTRGALPSLAIKQRGLIQYIVMVEYNDLFRLYFFTVEGKLLGAENFKLYSPLLSKISKTSKVLHSFPSKISRISF